MSVFPLNILLISIYELGRQPFGLASPAAWLRNAGFTVAAVDCAVQPFPESQVRAADVIAFYVPMHTATRLAVDMLKSVKQLNPGAHICFYGLYAPLNAPFLRESGVDAMLGGEFEEGLLRLCQRLAGVREKKSPKQARAPHNFTPTQTLISLNRQQFLTPDRSDLPDLENYAKLCRGDQTRVTGYTKTTRGCKYHCRHCPIVPVYGGQFRVVQRDVVLNDIRQQAAAGAQHITFGDPDFFNGPGHVMPIVETLHKEFPRLSYDVTIKISHLLKHAALLPVLRSTGCILVTSAVESLDNRILKIFDKGHSREDFFRVVKMFRQVGLTLNPTFVAFNPWTSLEGYRDFLATIARLNLVENVSPVQYAIRLLIPEGSGLLALPETRAVLGPFNRELLSYQWRHPDSRVDDFQREIMEIVNRGVAQNAARYDIFGEIWQCLNRQLAEDIPPPELNATVSRVEIPYLNEPWYC